MFLSFQLTFLTKTSNSNWIGIGFTIETVSKTMLSLSFRWKCTKTGVVHKLDAYGVIDLQMWTGWSLHFQINEHLASKIWESLIMPLGRHKMEDRDVYFNTACTILARKTEISTRKRLKRSAFPCGILEWITELSTYEHIDNKWSDDFLSLCEL